MTDRTKLIIVGGFLGAGKTTFLARVAKTLSERGLKVGLISNDQVPNLVDTEIFRGGGFGVREISGSCFCCNFNGFLAAAKDLAAGGADVVLAEPVGSCTDLSATIMNPLKKFHSDIFDLAPLSVLVDPVRLADVLCETRALHPDAAYILRKQMEEADIVLVNKSDMLAAEDRAEISGRLSEMGLGAEYVSGLDGENMDLWLSKVMEASESGSRIAEIDYARYANGEAVLGWLNAELSPDATVGSPEDFLKKIFGDFKADFIGDGMNVAHVKAFLTKGGRAYAANLTSLAGEVSVRDMGACPDGGPDKFIFNARVEGTPELLIAAAEKIFLLNGCEVRNIFCISPGEPRPTHRFSEVVK